MSGHDDPLGVAALSIYHGNTPVQPGGLFAPDRPRAPGFDHLIAGVSPASTNREKSMTTEKTTLRDRILVALRTGAKTGRELMQAASGSSGAVSTACKELHADGLICKPAGATTRDPWQLPNNGKTPMAVAPTTGPGRAASKKTRGPYKVKAKRRNPSPLAGEGGRATARRVRGNGNGAGDLLESLNVLQATVELAADTLQDLLAEQVEGTEAHGFIYKRLVLIRAAAQGAQA